MNRLVPFLVVCGLAGAATVVAAPVHRAGAHAPAPASAAAPRRLGDVRIAGELELPRVTFITARRPPRFHDFARTSWVRSSRQFAEAFAPPPWVSSTAAPQQDPRKETPR